MYSLKQTEAPTANAVSDALAQAYLKLGSDAAAASPELAGLIKAAIRQAEKITGRALMQQSWKMVLDDGWPANSIIRLPYPPLLSVESVKYIDLDNVQQTVASSLYVVDVISEPGRVYPVYGEVWPSALAVPKAVEVNFTCGYGEDGDDVADQRAAIPDEITTAILLMLNHAWENRLPVETGERAAAIEVPMTAEALLSLYRAPFFGVYP